MIKNNIFFIKKNFCAILFRARGNVLASIKFNNSRRDRELNSIHFFTCLLCVFNDRVGKGSFASRLGELRASLFVRAKRANFFPSGDLDEASRMINKDFRLMKFFEKPRMKNRGSADLCKR